MANILDYLTWRGDLDFQQDPFNHIDSLILSRFAYLPLAEALHEHEKISVKEAYERFVEKDLNQVHMLMESDPELFRLMAQSHRFQDCFVSDFVNEIVEKESLQFAAVTISLTNQYFYIAFRGTDNTLVGWNEDLNMCCQTRVPAQQYALRYIKNMMQKHEGKCYIGGHSKGGNLALYSALFLPRKYRERIVWADNFDGPGLSLELYEKKINDSMYERIYTFLPQGSVIGRLLYQNNTNLEVVFSVNANLYQHDLYSWQILQNHFVASKSFEKNSEIIDSSLKKFLETVTPAQRQQCIEVIFAVISSSHETTFHDLSENWYKHAPNLLKAFSKVEAEDRKMIMAMTHQLIELIIDELKENYHDESPKKA